MLQHMSLSRHLLLLVIWPAALAAQAITDIDFLERGREHFERRRFLNALESLRVSLQMNEDRDARTYPPKLDAEILAAECLVQLGRNDEAANMYERAITHGYSDKKAIAFLARYFYARRSDNKALQYFNQYLTLDRVDIETHILHARLLGRLKKRDKATELLESLEPAPANLKPEDCERHERRRQWREAFTCATALRNNKPEREQFYLLRYRLAALQKNPKLTADCAEELYHIFGRNTRYIWPLIEVRMAERRFYDARVLLEEIIAQNGEDSEAQRLLANLRTVAPQAVEKPFRATNKEMKMIEGLSK